MKFTNETKLGIFVTLSIIIMIVTFAFLGKLEFGEKGYIIKVKFTFIGDLKIDAAVLFAGGIRIGKVINILPYEDHVKVILQLKNEFRIKQGNEIVIYTHGMLGEKYVEIHGYEGEGEYLKDGDTIHGIDPVSFDAISIGIAKLMKGVFGPTLTDEEVKRSFASLFNNAGNFAYNLNMLIEENRQNIYHTINNLQSMAKTLDYNLSSVLKEIKKLSKDIGNISKKNQKSITSIIINLEKTSKQLTKTVGELEKSSKNLDHITSAIKKKKGTVGKLIYDKEIYNILLRTSQNLEKFSEIVKKKPGSLMWGK